MHRSSSSPWGVAFLRVTLAFATIGSVPLYAQLVEPAGAPADVSFRAAAAAQLDAAAADVRLGVLEGPIVLADLGVTVFVRSATTEEGAKTVVALDPQGNPVDLRQSLALDRIVGEQRRGKLARALHEAILRRAPDEPMTVVAWLDAPSLEPLRRGHADAVAALDAAGVLTRARAGQLQDEHSLRLRDTIGPITAQAAARFAAAGLEVVGQDEFAPVVFLRANLEELTPLLDDPQVLSLDDAGTVYQDRLNVAIGEVRANSAWSAPGGVSGAGAKVSIVESGRVCSTNPYLTVSATRVAGGGVSSHTTGVGSCVASTHPTYKGVAPGATLISANNADFTTGTTNVTTQMPGSVAAVSWSVSQGAHILNLSYGAGSPGSTVSSFDKYLDWIARYNAKCVVIACGNSGNYAGDPGAGYNQFAVGNFNDAGATSWSGESMAGSSSWRNPSTGVETPQMAAPGTNISMLSCSSPWTGYTASGTSFSSPITAGACALVVSKQAALGSWPEAVRAILMATAWHNIEGAAALSSRDGAGGIDALAAFRVAARGAGAGYAYGTLTPSSFDGSGNYTALSVPVTAGKTVRVCLSWDATPSGGPTYSPESLKADLDLYVYRGATQVAASTSGVQPFEVVQFTASATGTYTVKVRSYSFTGTSEYFGVALTTNTDA